MKEKIIFFALLSLTCAHIDPLPWQYPPDYCMYCKRIMKLTDNLATGTLPFTIDRLRNATGNLCSLIEDPTLLNFRATCLVIYDNADKVLEWYQAGIMKSDVFCAKLKLCHNDQIKKKKPWLKKLSRIKNSFKQNSVLNNFQKNLDLLKQKSSGFRDVVMKKVMPMIHLMKPHGSVKHNHRNKTPGNHGRHHHGHHRQHRHRHHKGHRRHGGHDGEQPTEKWEEKIFFKPDEEESRHEGNANKERIHFPDGLKPAVVKVANIGSVDNNHSDLSLPYYDDHRESSDSYDDSFDPFRSFLGDDVFNFSKEEEESFETESATEIPVETDFSDLPKFPKVDITTDGLFGARPFSRFPLFGNFDKIFGDTDKMMTEVMDKAKKTLTIFRSFSTKNDGNLKCQMCDSMVNFIASLYDKIPTEAFEKALNEKCMTDNDRYVKTACNIVLTNTNLIIELLKNKTKSTEICEMIGISNCTLSGDYTTTSIMTSTHSYKEKTPCNTMCGKLKEEVAYINEDAKDDLLEMKDNLQKFCAENDIAKVKCKNVIYMIDKVLGDLDEIEQPVKENEEVDKEEKCQCFTFQDPVDMSSKECDICKILGNGLMETLNQTMKTVDMLADVLEETICPYFPEFKEQCLGIVEELKDLFDERMELVDGICEKIGICHNDTHEFEEILKATIMHFKKNFKSGSLFLLGGAPMQMFGKKLSMGCQFCETCMENMEEKFKNMNTTEIEQAIPIIKSSFGIMCKSVSENDEMKTVCKTITDGIESVPEMITKKENRNELCKAVNLC